MQGVGRLRSGGGEEEMDSVRTTKTTMLVHGEGSNCDSTSVPDCDFSSDC